MLKSFAMEGKVEAVLITAPSGSVVSETYGHGSLRTQKVSKLQVFAQHGVSGDRHSGASRLADVRERELLAMGLPRGIEIANYREFSAVSVEELTEIAQSLNLPGEIPAGSLGENLILSGIPHLSRLPIGTLLFFKRKGGKDMQTAVLAVWRENTPCRGPGEVIQSVYPDVEGIQELFPKCAVGKRGVVGRVYCSGFIGEGDTVIAKIPDQEIYNPR